MSQPTSGVAPATSTRHHATPGPASWPGSRTPGFGASKASPSPGSVASQAGATPRPASAHHSAAPARPAYGPGTPDPSEPGLRTADSSGHHTWVRRVGAAAVDLVPLIAGIALVAVGYAWALLEAVRQRSVAPQWRAGAEELGTGLVLLAGGVLWMAVSRWWLQGRTGRSVGKRLLSLALVADPGGRPIGARMAALRDAVHLLDAVTVVGWCWPLWDARGRTFADMVMRTVVVRSTR